MRAGEVEHADRPPAVAAVDRGAARPACGGSVRESEAMWAAVSAARAMAGQREVVGVGVARALAGAPPARPRPQVTPAEAVRMMPSSSSSDDVRWCSK